MGPFTPRQNRFVSEYCLDLNATAAAKRSGYSPQSARQQGSVLLSNPAIAAAIADALANRSERTKVDADWVIGKLTENVERAMQTEPVRDAAGDPTGEYTHNATAAIRALELLGRHLGMWPTGAAAAAADLGDKPPGFIPLEERLAIYAREEEIARGEAGENVVRLGTVAPPAGEGPPNVRP